MKLSLPVAYVSSILLFIGSYFESLPHGRRKLVGYLRDSGVSASDSLLEELTNSICDDGHFNASELGNPVQVGRKCGLPRLPLALEDLVSTRQGYNQCEYEASPRLLTDNHGSRSVNISCGLTVERLRNNHKHPSSIHPVDLLGFPVESNRVNAMEGKQSEIFLDIAREERG